MIGKISILCSLFFACCSVEASEGRLPHKKAIVTGGNRGIGKAIALAFAQEGADVVIFYHSHPEEAETVVRSIEQLGGRSLAIQTNLVSLEETLQAGDLAIQFLGGVDILVNNAGIFLRTPFLEIQEADFDRLLGINFKGPFFLTQVIARRMIQDGTRGSIINISSIAAYRTFQNYTHYQCSKAALSMLTKGASLELAPYGIRVNAIEAGTTATDMNRIQWEGQPDVWKQRVSRIPLRRAGKVEDHAAMAVFLASDESSWVSGACIPVDGGAGPSF